MMWNPTDQRPHPRVQFIHGLESSPWGTKARRLARFFEVLAPEMDTRDFEASVATQAVALREADPELVVGSSFGGAVAVALVQRGLWPGPTLLLAPAALRYGLAPELPGSGRVWIVHGLGDTVIDPEDSRKLAASADPERVRLVLVDDDHRLSRSVALGRLEQWVAELDAASRA
jgi:pimeloyl-ACP methyl ester carboxylesterase